jgi:hypothetical protein
MFHEGCLRAFEYAISVNEMILLLSFLAADSNEYFEGTRMSRLIYSVPLLGCDDTFPVSPSL